MGTPLSLDLLVAYCSRFPVTAMYLCTTHTLVPPLRSQAVQRAALLHVGAANRDVRFGVPEGVGDGPLSSVRKGTLKHKHQ